MNHLINEKWRSAAPGEGVMEALSMGEPRWWKQTREGEDVAFVEFQVIPEKDGTKRLWIDSLWVPQNRRGQGEGFALLKKLLAEYGHMGAGLKVSPFQENMDKTRLARGYAGLGFKSASETPDILLLNRFD